MQIIRVIWRFALGIGLLELILTFFILINILTFALYVLDKQKAIKKSSRIREKTLLFFTLALGGFGALAGMLIMRHKTRHLSFRITVAAGLAIAVIMAIHIVHGLTLGKAIRYIEIPFHSENWPAELSGYRIAFMADIHDMREDALRGIVSELNNREIDLLLLGGDFHMATFVGADSYPISYYRLALKYISRINTTDGIFGVEGNHDCYRRVFAFKEYVGITPLDNSGLHIRDSFFLAGVHDLWNRSPCFATATADAHEDDFILMITHNPDTVMYQSTADMDLLLAGHTHGGQITFFGIPFYLLRGSITNYGTRFAYGFNYTPDNVPMFTTRGAGPYLNVPRVFAQPEVVIFTMN